MKAKIRAVLNDFGRFAEISSNIKTSRVGCKKYEIHKSYYILSIVDIERNDIEDVEECFVAAFIVYMFMCEELKDDMLETSKDFSESIWKDNIEKLFLPTYFENVKIQIYKFEKMIQEIKNDTKLFMGINEEQIKGYNERSCISIKHLNNYFFDLCRTFFCIGQNRIVYYDFCVCD